MPWMTPHRLTPITHSKSRRGRSATFSPRLPTPALLHTTCTPPKRSIVASASASTSDSSDVSTTTGSTSTPSSASVGRRAFERGRFDVGHHDLHAVVPEPSCQREPDPGRGAGDDRDLAGERLHVRSLSARTRAGTPSAACRGCRAARRRCPSTGSRHPRSRTPWWRAPVRRGRTARSAARRCRSSATCSMTGISRLTTTGASPSDSSSTTITLGLDASAWASTTICCSPPDSDRAVVSNRRSSSGNSCIA